MIPIYKPYITPKSLEYAHDALNSTWLSSHGKYLQLAQEYLQNFLGVKYVLPLNNGTSACHLMAKCVSQFHHKTKVIVPDNVYAAAWNAFLFDKDYELIPINADIDTWNVDLSKLHSTINAFPEAAVLLVHNIGNIINVPELKRKYPFTVFIEDNCEGLFGEYENIWSGTASFVSAISFFGNKNITSGEGGALITNNEDAYLYAKRVQNQGQSDTRFVHSELGYNYRMTNVQAAILMGQLELLPDILHKKDAVFSFYRGYLENRDDILLQQIPENTQHANWMFGVRLPGIKGFSKAEAFFRSHNVEIRPMFYPINSHPYIKSIRAHSNLDTSYHNARLLNEECIILPSYPELTMDEQNHIIHVLKEYVRRNT